MINRRTLLLGTAGAALTSLLTGCGRAGANLNITLLEGTIPSEVLQTFRKQADDPISFQLVSQIASVFQQLQAWQQTFQDADQSSDQDSGQNSDFSITRFLPWGQSDVVPRPDDLVSLGDYWLEGAIAQNLIEPLSLPAASLEKLPPNWQQFACRNAQGEMASKGSLWAVPYKVQPLVIVYRQSQFPQSSASNPPFTSWRDLLQPQFRQSLALPDHPRIVIGLAQKIQSGSFNPILEGYSSDSKGVIRMPVTESPSGSPSGNSSGSSAASSALLTEGLDSALVDTFAQINQQVKTYDSDNSLKALVNEDVKAVVCWSGDAVAAARRYSELRMVVPPEGSLLSLDMWVRPRNTSSGTEMSAAARQWIDFCWQREPAAQISLSGKGLSPIFLQTEVSLPKTLSESFPFIEAIKKSEPLLPIPERLQAAYLELWKQLRSGLALAR